MTVTTHLVSALLAVPLLVACERGDPPSTGAPTQQATATTPPAGPAPTTPSPPRGSLPPPATTRPAPPPVPPFPPTLRGQDIERVPTARKVVALTFDAGANAVAVPSILATLAREHVTATFFLTGDFVTQFPQAARSIVAAGHRLGNHSQTHPHFPGLTDAQLRAEVRAAEQAMRDVTGADPKPFFRFPFGDRDARTIAAVNGLGYACFRWTVDSLGWQGLEKHTAASVTARVLAAAQPGEIVLMHVGSHPTDRSTLDADALPDVITGLRARGYGFVTLDAVLG